MKSRLRFLYRVIICGFLVALSSTAYSQKEKYTVASAHSHNDYINPVPFYTAYSAGFGSIEADIFLYKGRLLVGHDSADMIRNRTLEQYYLRPLDSCVRSHNGSAYADKQRQLILLIDIKNADAANLDSLISLLKRYPALIHCHSLKMTITGGRPDASRFTSYPDFIWFDGVLSMTYSPEALTRIVLFSDNLRGYANWKGTDLLTLPDKEKLEAGVKKAHDQSRPVRFWNAPDTPYAWEQLISLHCDYINTDHIPELAAFLSKN